MTKNSMNECECCLLKKTEKKKTLLMLRKPKKNRKKQLMLNYIKSGFMPRYFCLVLAVSLWHPKFAIPDLI